MTQRVLLILILLIFKLNLQGQNYQALIAKDSQLFHLLNQKINSLEITNLSKLEEWLQSIDKPIKDASIIRRDIGYGAENQIWWVDILQTKHTEYFSMILHKDEIIAIKYNMDSSDESDITHINSEKLRELKGLKENEFGPISLPDSLIFPLEVKIFGHWCSIGGSPPDYCYEMLDLVNKRKKEVLKNWLLSFDPEIQAYGIEGIYYLERKGVPINEQEFMIINQIKKTNNMLIKCEGCFFYMRRKLENEFHKKPLKQRYKAFKETGWIYDK